jgi:hypothetical protein
MNIAAVHWSRIVRTLTAIAWMVCLLPRACTPRRSLTQMSDGLLHGGYRPFFDAMSSSMALSSIASANNFCRLAFSVFPPCSRLASDTSKPLYLVSHL